MTGFDLDAARAARREALGEPPALTAGGRSWVLPVECPWTVAEALVVDTTESFVVAIGDLLGDQHDEFLRMVAPSVPDMRDLLVGALGIYRAGSAGESPASPTGS